MRTCLFHFPRPGAIWSVVIFIAGLDFLTTEKDCSYKSPDRVGTQAILQFRVQSLCYFTQLITSSTFALGWLFSDPSEPQEALSLPGLNGWTVAWWSKFISNLFPEMVFWHLGHMLALWNSSVTCNNNADRQWDIIHREVTWEFTAACQTALGKGKCLRGEIYSNAKCKQVRSLSSWGDLLWQTLLSIAEPW